MTSFGQFVCDYGHVVAVAPGQKVAACPVCLQMTRQRVRWALDHKRLAFYASMLDRGLFEFDKLPRKVSPMRPLHRRVQEAIIDRFKAGEGVGELAADYLTVRPAIEAILRASLRRQRR